MRDHSSLLDHNDNVCPLNPWQKWRVYLFKNKKVTDYCGLDYYKKSDEWDKKNATKNTGTLIQKTKPIITAIKNANDYKYFWIIAISFFAILLLKKR